MKILAIETSSDACSAALAIGDEVYEVFRVAPREHTQLILPMIEEVLAQGECVLSQLDAIAFGRGPGAFTGVRVAASVTQGIAFGADLPVVAVSSLAALAYYGHRMFNASHAVVATDARLGEVYAACYAVEYCKAELLGIERVIKAEDFPLVEHGQWLAIGNGWGVFQQQLAARVTAQLSNIVSDVYPRAHDIACLARHGQRVSAEQALPVYLRDNVTS
jgi:tRNA threonylcarbamoyladenosine biosynthesis protein TsaB